MTLTHSPDQSDAIRRLIVINSIIGVTTAGISTRIFVISAPTLAAALDTDMLGISWALIVYQMAGIGLGVICGRLWPRHRMTRSQISPRGAKSLGFGSTRAPQGCP